MTRLERTGSWIGSLALGVLVPRAALACSVCSAGRDDETRAAFLLTTVVLSALPLLLVGGFAWWLRRQLRASDRPAASPARAPLTEP